VLEPLVGLFTQLVEEFAKGRYRPPFSLGPRGVEVLNKPGKFTGPLFDASVEFSNGVLVSLCTEGLEEFMNGGLRLLLFRDSGSAGFGVTLPETVAGLESEAGKGFT
jgi:hypothetical protein